jgi:hypothetical protein
VCVCDSRPIGSCRQCLKMKSYPRFPMLCKNREVPVVGRFVRCQDDKYDNSNECAKELKRKEGPEDGDIRCADGQCGLRGDNHRVVGLARCV